MVPALAFDGQTLRLTRRVEPAWRWWPGRCAAASGSAGPGPAVTRTRRLQEAWLRSQQLLGNEPGQLRLLDGVGEWQVYFYRGNAWTNAQSSGDLSRRSAPAAGRQRRRQRATALPDGVRLVIACARQLPDAVRLVITLDGRTLHARHRAGAAGS